ncbi:hypothetical protein HO173_012628 [Letharia columbiana]|uniref:Uncharacterized protein n=1 Tax=Letharia columbiana TaxID=112416 RepID=A0A8H6CMR7_9LECA|nr:uncharacterized protein HO173_012628 [Letharia columbiana]KAF6225961.1 hypothetical protein HO173_012628 [Letharia columbiana]
MNTIVFGHPSANPLLLAIEAASEPNSYLLLLINAHTKRVRTSYALHDSTSNHHSASEEHHCNLAIPHQIITQQAENTTVTWPVIPTALRSKRRNYNRQMRRTLRRNQAATRPPSSRTRLSSPRSHVICSPRFHTIPHQIITQQAENTTVTWPVIPTALRSKRRNYNRQMRRTLRRNQAATRPPSSRTRLSSPRSHSDTLQEEEQEEELQQANAENTAEKPSGNKATIVKNTAQLSKIPRYMLSTIPYQIITQQAENTTVTWPVIPTALRSKRRNYNRQMRRILRRNQAATRPPSSRTRLSSPRSHVICSPRFHIKSSLSKRRTPLQLGRSTSNHHSASGEHHCNLACYPHYIEEQEEELQQANAENTAEKPSGNKATIVKNTAQLSKIPRQIITQQAENTTATWPVIPTNMVHHCNDVTRGGSTATITVNWASAGGTSDDAYLDELKPSDVYSYLIIRKISLRQEILWDSQH